MKVKIVGRIIATDGMADIQMEADLIHVPAYSWKLRKGDLTTAAVTNVIHDLGTGETIVTLAWDRRLDMTMDELRHIYELAGFAVCEVRRDASDT